MIMQFRLVLYFIVFTSAILERQDTKQIDTGALVSTGIGNNCPLVGKNIARGQVGKILPFQPRAIFSQLRISNFQY